MKQVKFSVSILFLGVTVAALCFKAFLINEDNRALGRTAEDSRSHLANVQKIAKTFNDETRDKLIAENEGLERDIKSLSHSIQKSQIAFEKAIFKHTQITPGEEGNFILREIPIPARLLEPTETRHSRHRHIKHPQPAGYRVWVPNERNLFVSVGGFGAAPNNNKLAFPPNRSLELPPGESLVHIQIERKEQAETDRRRPDFRLVIKINDQDQHQFDLPSSQFSSSFTNARSRYGRRAAYVSKQQEFSSAKKFPLMYRTQILGSIGLTVSLTEEPLKE